MESGRARAQFVVTRCGVGVGGADGWGVVDAAAVKEGGVFAVADAVGVEGVEGVDLAGAAVAVSVEGVAGVEGVEVEGEIVEVGGLAGAVLLLPGLVVSALKGQAM